MKLLDFMWGKSYKDYPNLCPLFWTVVGSVAILPLFLIIMPFATVEPLRKFITIIGKGITGLFIGFLLFVGWIATSALTIEELYVGRVNGDRIYLWTFVILVSVVLFIAILIGSFMLMEYISDWIYEHRAYKYNKYIEPKPEKEKKQSLIISFIKSVYYKNCPFINWK